MVLLVLPEIVTLNHAEGNDWLVAYLKREAENSFQEWFSLSCENDGINALFVPWKWNSPC